MVGDYEQKSHRKTQKNTDCSNEFFLLCSSVFFCGSKAVFFCGRIFCVFCGYSPKQYSVPSYVPR